LDGFALVELTMQVGEIDIIYMSVVSLSGFELTEWQESNLIKTLTTSE
jgi:hypothetical protein